MSSFYYNYYSKYISKSFFIVEIGFYVFTKLPYYYWIIILLIISILILVFWKNTYRGKLPNFIIVNIYNIIICYYITLFKKNLDSQFF